MTFSQYRAFFRLGPVIGMGTIAFGTGLFFLTTLLYLYCVGWVVYVLATGDSPPPDVDND